MSKKRVHQKKAGKRQAHFQHITAQVTHACNQFWKSRGMEPPRDAVPIFSSSFHTTQG